MKYEVRVGMVIGNTYIVEADDMSEARMVAEEMAGCDSLNEFEVGDVNSEVLHILDTEIRIGDIVQVMNVGKQYSTYGAFFQEHNLSNNMSSKYISNNPHGLVKGYNYVVLYKGKHNNGTTNVCAIKDETNGDVYLVGEDGLAAIWENKIC